VQEALEEGRHGNGAVVYRDSSSRSTLLHRVYVEWSI
jgi:hypothetical protein